MAVLIDLHVHTRLHSSCSQIEPDLLIPQAVRAGLDGLVITEHHYQWREEDLALLAARSGCPDFLLMTGFEYGSTRGDILIYGLAWQDVQQFPMGLSPEEAVRRARDLGGNCIAAHPTRAGMGFDDRILLLSIDAVEVASINLRDDEQQRAAQWAQEGHFSPVAASDAHRIYDVGRYATEFYDDIGNMKDLQQALVHGKFRPRAKSRMS